MHNLDKMSKKNTFRKEKLETDKYVNIETGETLQSEHPTITSVNKHDTDYVKFKSESFYIIDDTALRYLENNINRSDMLHVHTIMKMVYGNYNILHDKNINVHTKETLMRDLELARNAFNRLLKKLYSKGVIYYIDGYKDGKKIKYIMLNPNLARRTNIIHRECSKVFQTFE